MFFPLIRLSDVGLKFSRFCPLGTNGKRKKKMKKSKNSRTKLHDGCSRSNFVYFYYLQEKRRQKPCDIKSRKFEETESSWR